MNKYTMGDWERDGRLSCKIGQKVADDVVDELANCVPPKYFSSTVVQVGEAADHDPLTFSPLYDTFVKNNDEWVYYGANPDWQTVTDKYNVFYC